MASPALWHQMTHEQWRMRCGIGRGRSASANSPADASQAKVSWGRIATRDNPATSSGDDVSFSTGGVVRWTGRRRQPQVCRTCWAALTAASDVGAECADSLRLQQAPEAWRAEGIISDFAAVQRGQRSSPVEQVAQRAGSGSNIATAVAWTAAARTFRARQKTGLAMPELSQFREMGQASMYRGSLALAVVRWANRYGSANPAEKRGRLT